MMLLSELTFLMYSSLISEGHIDTCRISRKVDIRVPKTAREVRSMVNSDKLYKAELEPLTRIGAEKGTHQ